MNNLKLKKTLAYTLIIILTSFFLTGCLSEETEKDEDDNMQTETKVDRNNMDNEDSESKNYILEGYPLDIVPLYEMSMINSMIFFVDDDPQAYRTYFDDEVNYYNVVYQTNATKEQLFEYYEKLMSHLENSSKDNRIGKINKYKVSVSSYENNDVYLQVYLPSKEYSKENRYFDAYPDLVKIDKSWVEHESRYGRVNQLGGEVLYGRIFTMDSEEQRASFYEEYSKIYKDKDKFENNKETRTLSWEENGYSVNLIFHMTHNRIYLTFRGSL